MPFKYPLPLKAIWKKYKGWYETIMPGLGNDFILSIEDTLAHIQNYPEIYSLIHHIFRRAMIRRFPYGILFRVEGAIIKVSGILHTSRSPEAWQSRMQ